MFRHLSTLLLAFAPMASAGLSGETGDRGLPVVQAFRPHDYGDEHNQTWSAVQDRRGTLYVGNRDAILTYDGFAWRTLRVNGVFLRGLAIDADDRIWVGGVNELGVLEDDGHGGRKFTSLRDRLPPGERDFGNIFQVFAFSHGIYFITFDSVLWWHDGRFSVEKVGHVFANAVGDELVVHARGQPLMAWRGAQRRVVCDAPELRRNDHWVTFAAAQPDGAWILGTLQGGLWRLAQGQLAPFPTGADATFRSASIARGLALRDGTMALALRPGGLLLLGPRGEVRHYLDRDNGGLPNAALHGLFQDRAGDLWVLLDQGLARIVWPDKVSLFSDVNGLGRGTLHAVLRHRGVLYAGAFDGLFALQERNDAVAPPREARFRMIPHSQNNVLALAAAGGDLLAGGAGGVWMLGAGDTLTQIFRNDACLSLLVPRRDERVALVGTAGTVAILRRDAGQWHSAGVVEGLDNDEMRNLVEAPDGALWIASASHGFYRLCGVPGTGSAGTKQPRVERYPGGHGLPARVTDLPVVVEAGGEPLFLVADRLYRFDALRRSFAPMAVGDGGLRVRGVGAGADGGVWVRLERDHPEGIGGRDSYVAHLGPEGQLRFLPGDIAGLSGQSLVFREETGEGGTSQLWLGGTEGMLLRVELPAAFSAETPFHAIIRRVTRTGGMTLPLGAATPPALPYAARNLTFAFATDRLATDGARFQVRIDGEANWSEPLPGAAFPLAAMQPGGHRLAVRAIDRDGQISTAAEFAFGVGAPWWDTAWAKAGYGLLAALAVLGFLRWRLSAVRRRNTELEGLIAHRTRELQLAKLGAESASKAKSAFLANMSHELRTPLNAILGYAQILRKETGLTEKGHRQLEVVGRNGEHLLQMINEVLDLAKIEAGKMTLHAAEFPLMRLVKSAAGGFELRAADKQLAFRLELGAGLPKLVLSDEPKLRQVLYNLLGNAVKFTAAGEIVFSVTQGDGRVRFEVRDTGPGIAADQWEAIFQPFHQAASGASAEGTGLGLTISQRIVELLGGKIQVESAPGRGSRFWFELTLREIASAAAPAAIRRITGYRGPQRRVLVADDEETNRAVLRDLLEPLGFVVAEAADGAAAVAAAAANPPDVLLLDLRMPALGGLEAVGRLRAMPALRDLPIIVISASVFAFNQQEALAAGCEGFLPKPVHESQLLETLARTLGLEWEFDERRPARETVATNEGLPSPEEIAALGELVSAGDLAGLRERIAAALARGETGAAFLRQLDELAAAFRTAELRQKLADARCVPTRS